MIKKGRFYKLITFLLAVVMIFSVTVVTASAGTTHKYDRNNISKITKEDIQTIRKCSWGGGFNSFYPNKEGYYVFSNGGNKVYIKKNAILNPKDTTSDRPAWDHLYETLNGAPGGSVSYLRIYTGTTKCVPTGKNGKYLVLAYYSVSACNSRGKIEIQSSLDEAATIQYDGSSKQGAIGFPGIKLATIKSNLSFSVSKGNVFNYTRLKNGKKVKYYAHGGALQYFRLEGKGYLTPNYSFRDYARTAVEAAKTVKNIGENISTGNMIGLASNGVTVFRAMKKSSSVYKTDGDQYLLADKNVSDKKNKEKLPYKLSMTNPIQLRNVGDYYKYTIQSDANHLGKAWVGIISYYN